MGVPRLRVVNLEQGSPEWHDWRNGGIGASEGLRAMNFSRDLWLEKTGQKKRKDFQNAAMRRGSELEEVAREIFEAKHMVEVVPMCGQRRHIRASADGVNRKEKVGVEIKCPTSEDVHANHCKGTVEQAYYHQMQQNMYVFGFKEWYFVSYQPGADEPYHEQVIKRDNKYIARMVEKLDEFWRRVEAREWPDGLSEVERMVAESAPTEAAPAIEIQDVPATIVEAVNGLIAIASEIEVSDGGGAAKAADIGKAIAELQKKLESKRKEIVEPHNKHIKEINDKFKVFSKPLGDCLTALKSKVDGYLEDTGELVAMGATGKMAVRQNVSVKVLDIDAVPAEYKKVVVDETAVKKAVATGKEIPGVELTKKRTIVVS